MTIDELLQTQSISWRSGNPMLIEELVPNLMSLSNDDLLNLVCNEVRLRSELGQASTLDEYQERFSFLSPELETQWAIDALLDLRGSRSELTSMVDAKESAVTTATCAPSLPANIGRYEILRELGRGAAGVVYEGFDANLNRSVAIKCLRSDLHSDSTQLQRFRLEAETVGRLRHPNIAQVYDSGRDCDLSYIVMEYCDHGTLADLVGEPQSADRAMGLIRQLTSAVAAAHAQSIIHRDLKPANVLLSIDAEGHIVCKVADFGLAKWVDAESSATKTGSVLGSPAYMAPEQATGRPTEIAYQADVYSLGAILFHLLTGRPPFLGSTVADTLYQMRYTDPLEIKQLNPQVPRELETIVAKCLKKNPQLRYETAQALLDDLNRFASGKPILAKREGQIQKIVRLSKRNPQVATLIGVTIALLSIIALGSLWNARTLRRERNLAREATRQAQVSAKQALVASRESSRAESQSRQALESLKASEEQRLQILYRSLIDETWAAFYSGGQGQRTRGELAIKRLVSVYPYSQMNSEQRLEVRRALAACLSQPDLREISVLLTDRNLGYSVDVDPAMQTVAYPDDQQATIMKSLKSGEGRMLSETDQASSQQYFTSRRWFSPDGRWLYESLYPKDLNEAKRVRLWDVRTGQTAARLEGGFDNFAFHSDGRQFFFVLDSRVMNYDLLTGQLLRESPRLFRDRQIAISPNGRWLAVWGGARSPALIGPDNWQVQDTIPIEKSIVAAAWKPDSKELLLASDSKTLFVWSPERRLLWERSDIPDEPGATIRFCPDARLLSVSGASRTQLIDLVTDNSILDFPGTVLQLSSTNGQVVVRRGQDIILCKLVPAASSVQWNRTAAYTQFSPSGRWLAISGEHGTQFLDTELLRYDADLGLDPSGPATWSPQEDELITYGIFSHICRWPATRLPDKIRLGPPKAIVLDPARARLGADNQVPQHDGRFSVWLPDGRYLFFSDYRHGRVFRVDSRSGLAEPLFEQPFPHQLSVSPDGRLVAVSSVSLEETQLWDIETRRSLFRWKGGSPRFSSDGRHLMLGTRDSIVAIDTRTWSIKWQKPTELPHPIHPVPVEVHPNSKMVAVAHSDHSVRLLEIETGKTILELVYRDADTIRWLSFPGDGKKLAVTRSRSFGFWNFQTLGIEMARIVPEATELRDRMEFDHVQSATVPEITTNGAKVDEDFVQATAKIETIDVDRGAEMLPPGRWWTGYQLLATFEALQRNYPDAIDDLSKALQLVLPDDSKAKVEILVRRAQYHTASGNAHAALGDLRQAIRLQPDHRDALRRLADLLLSGPEELRDVDEGQLIQSRLDQ